MTTRVLELFWQHHALLNSEADYSDDDKEADRIFQEQTEKLAAAMMAEPCTCAADFAAKVIVDTYNAGALSDWETGALWKEARELVWLHKNDTARAA